MDNISGPPVEDDNFFGRDLAVADLCESLHNHDVLLLGPRRIGKTSAARAIMKKLIADDWKAIEINVASCTDEREFVAKFAKALDAEAKSRPARIVAAFGGGLAALLGRVSKVQLPGSTGFELRAETGEGWSDVASDTLRLMSSVPGHWLIYVDELPIMLFNIINADPAHGIARVRRFLDWFRNDVRAIPECKQVRWLVTGSVGLDTLVQRHGMADTINSLKPESLAPYDGPMAQQMLDRLAASYNISFADGDTAYLVQAIGWPQPYYLQQTFNHLRQLHRASPSTALRTLIDEAITKLSEPDSDNDFKWWRQRLSMQLGPADGAHANALLAHAAKARDGVTSRALLSILEQRMPNADADEQQEKFVELRDILLRDAYWSTDAITGPYRFNLEPLRQWWVRRNTV